MSKEYNQIPEFEPEEEEALSFLMRLSAIFNDQIEEKRDNALKVLVNQKKSAKSKKLELNEYFAFRMDPERYIASLDGKVYALNDLVEKASWVYHTYKNDNPIVLDCMSFFEDSFAKGDIILALHNYRLTQDDVSLYIMIKLIGIMVVKNFSVDGVDVGFTVPTDEMPLDNTIALFRTILVYVDSYIGRAYGHIKEYLSKFELTDEVRELFSERIDNLASQQMAKSTPLEERIDYLMRSFRSKDTISESFYGSGLKWLIYDLFMRIKYPKFSDLYQYVKQQFEIKPDDRNKELYDIVNHMKECSDDEFFDQNNTITTDDIEYAELQKDDVETIALFENLRKNIWLLFAIIVAVDEMPEIASDKKSKHDRERRARELCRIFENQTAYEELTDTEYDRKYLSEHERKISDQKIDLLLLYIESIGHIGIEDYSNKYLEILDKAKAIDPDDVDFIEKSSRKILRIIQDSLPSASIDGIKFHLNETLNAYRTLKESVIDTLATAEYLFKRYANELYAEQGFDFSCISALYYQAFEDAYHDLIWKGYAGYLNGLLIGGKKFTQVLQDEFSKKEDGDFQVNSPVYGYLPNRKKNWTKYICYDDKAKTRQINSECMYGSFSKFMNEFNNLPNFQIWLSTKCKFFDENSMLNCVPFMNLLSDFSYNIKSAANNRNNASHGGSVVDLEQCKKDKLAVLADISEIHDVYLGLLQELVSLFTYNQRLPQ